MMNGFCRGDRQTQESAMSEPFRSVLKIIAFAYINRLAKFGVFVSCGLKDIDLVNYEMVNNTKT